MAINKYKTGDVFSSKNSGKFKIVEYSGNAKYLIEFIDTGYRKLTTASDITRGSVKDLYCPNIQSVGYCGEGVYPLTYKRKGKKYNTPAYEVWLGKLKICYGESKSVGIYKDKGVTVCKEWYNFQNFAKWFYEQVKLYGKGGFVDKDLQYLGNREYHPDLCVYVPPSVNSLFTGKRGNISGVHFCNTKQKWVAQLQKGELSSTGNKRQSYLGTFHDKESADKAYYEAKVEHVKQVALKHQDKLPPMLFYKLYTGTENYLNYYMFHNSSDS